jgi:hypothetical protein
MIQFDPNSIMDKIRKRTEKAQYLLDMQVIKDSNLYCPEDVGDLQDSAILGYKTGGQVVWDVEYAKNQYYSDNNKSKDKNPRASMKWFEVAKAENLQAWEKLANDQYNS